MALDVVFVLVPRFSMIALYGALEPLRVANRFAGPSFAWRFVSADGQPVAASNEIPVSVSGGLKDIGRPAMAVFLASFDHEQGSTRAMRAALHKLARGRVLIAGIDTAPFLLAEAGVLDDCRATCHWESLPGFRESFPRVRARQSLFEIDGERLSCAGGSAAIDMMLAWIARLHGPKLAVMVADQLMHFRVPEERGEARAPARARHGTDDPRLLAIIAAMEDHMEEPLDAAALAAIGGLSTRQMERLFAKRLDKRPMGYYLELRLDKAAQLLRYSHMSVRDVGVACGFSSPARFSRAFRTRHCVAPRSIRQS